MGTGSVCRRAGTRCDAARRRVEKIRTVRAITPGYPNAARRRASLGDSAHRAVTRQHHLRRTGYDRAEAARLDARVLERDAHGLHFPRHRQLWCSWCDRRRGLDVCSRCLNRAAIWHRRRIAPANGHVGL